MLDFLTDFPSWTLPLGLYLTGLITPNPAKYLDRLVNSKQYKLLQKIYQEIDPQLLQQIQGQVPLVELVHTAINSVSDRQLTTDEVRKMTTLAIRDFSLLAALKKQKISV